MLCQMNYMKNLNAIDEPMAQELIDAFSAANEDPEVRVVVLKGGQKAFSAGGDIGFFYQLIQEGGKINMDPLISSVGVVADMMKKMGKMVITSVSGAAAGADSAAVGAVAVSAGASASFFSSVATFASAGAATVFFPSDSRSFRRLSRSSCANATIAHTIDAHAKPDIKSRFIILIVSTP